MIEIIAGQKAQDFYEGLASELPDVEPDVADLAAIEGDLFELVQDRLLDLDTQLATHGHVDDLATRRYRRQVRAELRATATAEVAA